MVYYQGDFLIRLRCYFQWSINGNFHGLANPAQRLSDVVLFQEDYGLLKLFMRQLPISGLYNDILLGMSTVSHCDFWIGTALGFLPLGVTATLAGAGAIQADISHLHNILASLPALSFYCHYH